jgi:transposase InsO family protein
MLLADSPLGCHHARKELQDMPVSCKADPHTGADATSDPILMALHCVGARHCGAISLAIGGYRFLYVTIDKFTKWPEATPVVKINKQSTVKFIKSIIRRFGVPNRIIIDNGSQFTSGAF